MKIEKVEVYSADDIIKIKVTFKSVNLKAKLKEDDFVLEDLIDVTKDENKTTDNKDANKDTNKTKIPKIRMVHVQEQIVKIIKRVKETLVIRQLEL